MSNRLPRILPLVTSIATTALVVAAFTGFRPAGPVPAPRAEGLPAEAEAVLLPAVVVRPEAHIPRLSEVTVRPSRAERLAAGLEVEVQHEAPLDRVAGSGGSHALLRGGGGLAMPYYSFGKPLPRTNEE